MVDAEQLIYFLLRRDVPAEFAVTSEIDVDSTDNLPLVTFAIGGDGQSDNGPGLWHIVLDINVFGAGRGPAYDSALTVYDAVSAWNDSAPAVLPGVGWVHSVNDVSLFSRLASANINGRNVTQYSGSFALAVRT